MKTSTYNDAVGSTCALTCAVANGIMFTIGMQYNSIFIGIVCPGLISMGVETHIRRFMIEAYGDFPENHFVKSIMVEKTFFTLAPMMLLLGWITTWSDPTAFDMTEHHVRLFVSLVMIVHFRMLVSRMASETDSYYETAIRCEREKKQKMEATKA